jgi:hypothetical protein
MPFSPDQPLLPNKPVFQPTVVQPVVYFLSLSSSVALSKNPETEKFSKTVFLFFYFKTVISISTGHDKATR